MTSEQQNETLRQFREDAGRWRVFSDGGTEKVNVSLMRHQAVIQGSADLPANASFLDVGCGAGQLVIEMASRGLKASGIDFSPEMIAICREKAREANVTAAFECVSAFEMAPPEKPYDALSAQGFIEYISPEQMESFFALASRFVADGGSFFVGSRNRLFNLCSLNSYTQLELDLGTERRLLQECVLLASTERTQDLFNAVGALPRLTRHPERHPSTGIKVSSRFQYTPGELIAALKPHGFAPVTVYPIHYHALPVSVAAADRAELHRSIANLMAHEASRDHRLVPNSSSFVLHLKKLGRE